MFTQYTTLCHSTLLVSSKCLAGLETQFKEENIVTYSTVMYPSIAWLGNHESLAVSIQQVAPRHCREIVEMLPKAFALTIRRLILNRSYQQTFSCSVPFLALLHHSLYNLHLYRNSTSTAREQRCDICSNTFFSAAMRHLSQQGLVFCFLSHIRIPVRMKTLNIM